MMRLPFYMREENTHLIVFLKYFYNFLELINQDIRQLDQGS